MGHEAVGLTDCGSMRGIYELHEESARAGIRPIYGVSVALVPDARRRAATKEEKDAALVGVPRERWHEVIAELGGAATDRDPPQWINLWAEDDVGLRSLFRLTSESWIDGFYYRPRVDLASLQRHADGVHCGTAGFDGAFGTLAQAKQGEAERLVVALRRIYGERMSLEVQPHRLLAQARTNQLALQLSQRYGIPLVATQCAHYLDAADLKHHRMLASLGGSEGLDEAGMPGNDHWFKTADDMVAGFQANHRSMTGMEIGEAMERAAELAQRFSAKLTIDKVNMLVPEIDDAAAKLRRACEAGWERRKIDAKCVKLAEKSGSTFELERERYAARLERELAALAEKRFEPYVLLVADVYDFARAKGIYSGPGRGSAAGALTCWLTGITAVDPLEHDLLFERFISPQRNDTPDIDMDFERDRRHEIVDYLREKYGAAHTAQICTFSKLKGPVLFNEITKALCLVDPVLPAIRKAIDKLSEDRKAGDKRYRCTAIDAIADPQFAEFATEHPELAEHCKPLEGLMKHSGKHPAAMVVCPIPLCDVLPLETTTADKGSSSRSIVTAVDMQGASAMRALKLDVLGLKTMSVIRLACESISEQERRSFGLVDLEALPLNDPQVIAAFTAGRFDGVFQFETPSARRVCRGLKFQNFGHVAAMNAINRPGTTSSGMYHEFVKRVNDPSARQTIYCEKIDRITDDAAGVMCYQEHVSRILIEVAGFSPGDADTVRRKISKSKGKEQIAKEAPAIREGCAKHTPEMSPEKVEALIDQMIDFGRYSFNKSHAVAYAIVSYWCMWLKIYHPLEFWAAMLSCENDKKDAAQHVRAALRDGVRLMGPCVSRSRMVLSVDSQANAIRSAIVDVAGIGEATAKAIVAAQPFASLDDFGERMVRTPKSAKLPKGAPKPIKDPKKKPIKINRKHFGALVESGAFDALPGAPTRRQLMEQIDEFWDAMKGGADAPEPDGGEDFTESKKEELAAAVTTTATDRWATLAESLPIVIADMQDEEFMEAHADDAGTWIRGTLEACRMYSVGQYNPEPATQEEKDKIGWGKPYASGMVTDAGGARVKVKIEGEAFDRYEKMVRAAKPIDVLVLGKVGRAWGKFQATYKAILIVPMQAIADAAKDDAEPPSVEVLAARGNPPHLGFTYKRPDDERRSKWRFDSLPAKCRAQEEAGATEVTVVVVGTLVGIRRKHDKNDNEMAWISLLGKSGCIEATCFSRQWGGLSKEVQGSKFGDVMRLELRWQSDGFVVQGPITNLSAAKTATKKANRTT